MPKNSENAADTTKLVGEIKVNEGALTRHVETIQRTVECILSSFSSVQFRPLVENAEFHHSQATGTRYLVGTYAGRLSLLISSTGRYTEPLKAGDIPREFLSDAYLTLETYLSKYAMELERLLAVARPVAEKAAKNF